jgi:hypothetical protein
MTKTLIHQIVLGKKIPPLNQECLQSWNELLRYGFDVVRWTDERIHEYLASYPRSEVTSVYRRARNYGEASDILRMAITYSYGGFYVDWDVLLVDPDRFLGLMGDFESDGCVLIRDRLTTEPSFSCTHDNSLFFLSRGNPFAVDFLRAVERNYAANPLPNTPYLTGPLALTRFLEANPKYKSACRMIDTREIYAFDYEGVVSRTEERTRGILKQSWNSSDAPAIHFWTHTWPPKRTWSQRLLNKVSRTVRIATGAR